MQLKIFMFTESEQTEQDLAREIQRADVVCLVYAVDDNYSLQQITERWLPLLQSLRPSVKEDEKSSSEVVMSEIPIVLVGNKSDLLDQGNMEAVLPIMNHYTEIETCIEVFFNSKSVCHSITEKSGFFCFSALLEH